MKPSSALILLVSVMAIDACFKTALAGDPLGGSPDCFCPTRPPMYCDPDPCPYPWSCIPFGDLGCCDKICSSGPEGAFCLNVAWDWECCDLVDQLCAPLGACCDWVNTDANGEAVCRNVPLSKCPMRPDGSTPQWIEGASCESQPFDPPCGVAACCHYQENPITHALEEVCEDLTKSECFASPPLEHYRNFQPGQLCGTGSHVCPILACYDSDESCMLPHSTPGCSDSTCCEKVALQESYLITCYCRCVAWDSACVTMAEQLCDLPIPNDECAPGPSTDQIGAVSVPVPGSRATINSRATTNANEPGFCCNTGTGECVGGTNDEARCVVATDCNSGVCTDRQPEPGAQALGTIWFKFVPPAGVTSVGVSTCISNPPALDSIVQVFAATDHSSPLGECNSLVPIGCNDDYPNCGSTGRNSRLCLRNLTPGETYYIELAAKTPNRLGQYIVTISTNCSGETPPCTNCPAGEIMFVDPPSGVVDARRPFPPNHPEMAEGTQSIVATGPRGATKDCWSICQSPEVPASIQIASVEESPPGTYSIQLSRPISPGVVTTIIYTDEATQKTTARFTFHPGNVNADSVAFATDIMDLVDYLNGLRPLPWGEYSGDLDRSGMIRPADILTLIDLLNGTNGYLPWWGTPLPSGECP